MLALPKRVLPHTKPECQELQAGQTSSTCHPLSCPHPPEELPETVNLLIAEELRRCQDRRLQLQAPRTASSDETRPVSTSGTTHPHSGPSRRPPAATPEQPRGEDPGVLAGNGATPWVGHHRRAEHPPPSHPSAPPNPTVSSLVIVAKFCMRWIPHQPACSWQDARTSPSHPPNTPPSSAWSSSQSSSCAG